MSVTRKLQAQVLCQECGYDLRGSPQHGRCPECNSEYDQQALLAEQSRSQRPMPLGLKIVGVLSTIYLGLAVMVVVAEEILHAKMLPWEKVVAPILVIGGPVMMILYAIAVGEMRLGQLDSRPFYDGVRWIQLPRRIRF